MAIVLVVLVKVNRLGFSYCFCHAPIKQPMLYFVYCALF